MFLAIIRKTEGKGPGATKSAILPKALVNIFSFQNTYKKVKYNFKKIKAGNMAYPLELPSQFFFLTKIREPEEEHGSVYSFILYGHKNPRGIKSLS